MQTTDTINLIQECDVGTKMAVSSIDEILESVHDNNMKQLLQESKAHHKELEGELLSLMDKYKIEEKEPSAIAKGMSWIKTNMKMRINGSDETAADLITDGCNMGIKSLNRYLNQYKMADNSSKNICMRLISIEEQLCREMRKYL